MVKNSKKSFNMDVNQAKAIVSHSIKKDSIDNKSFIEKSKVSPTIDIRFLHQSNKCFKFALNKFQKSKNEYYKYLDDLQEFIYEFSSKESYDMAMKCYSSHINGQKTKGKIESQLLNFLPEDVKKVAKDELTHLHLKANGKDESLVHGFSIGDRFYIIALDPKHELI